MRPTLFITVVILATSINSDIIDPNYNYDMFMVQFSRTYEG